MYVLRLRMKNSSRQGVSLSVNLLDPLGEPEVGLDEAMSGKRPVSGDLTTHDVCRDNRRVQGVRVFPPIGSSDKLPLMTVQARRKETDGKRSG